MTSQEINIAIAEFCGFNTSKIDEEGWEDAFNYYESLDAIHEAEIKLSKEQFFKYSEELMDTVCASGDLYWTRPFCATS